MKNNILLFAFIILANVASGHAAPKTDNNSIVVQLETDVQLLPMYFATLRDEQSGFDPAYLKQLEKVLSFDFENNGMTFLVKREATREALVQNFEQPGSSAQWKAQNVFYVVLGKVNNKQLSVRVLSVNNNTFKAIKDVALTGDLSKDRRQLHQLADTIHKSLFGTDGIASTRILYTLKSKGTNGDKWLSDIWEADYDGGNSRPITQDKGYCVTPAYVPPRPGYTSGSLFYVSYQNGQPKIFYGSLKEGGGRRFSYMRGNQLMPTVSRQRNRVAFISDITGNPDLFLLDFDPETGAIGKPQQVFTARQAVQGSPSFSPDGKKIAFVSNKDGSARIYIMDIPTPGTNVKNLAPKLISKQSRESTAPAWSPDGTKVAFCAMAQGVRQIWIYDIEKSEERQLTQGPGNKENPTWAPNSLHLIFNSTAAQDSELYLINLHQPKAIKISAGSGEKHYPNWEPKL